MSSNSKQKVKRYEIYFIWKYPLQYIYEIENPSKYTEDQIMIKFTVKSQVVSESIFILRNELS